MYTPRKKVNIRSYKAQINHLLQYMLSHPEFAATVSGHQPEVIEEWEALKAELDQLGPCRSVEQWKTCWRDQKRKASFKEKAMEYKGTTYSQVELVVEPTNNSEGEIDLDNVKDEMEIEYLEDPIEFSDQEDNLTLDQIQTPSPPKPKKRIQPPKPVRSSIPPKSVKPPRIPDMKPKYVPILPKPEPFPPKVPNTVSFTNFPRLKRHRRPMVVDRVVSGQNSDLKDVLSGILLEMRRANDLKERKLKILQNDLDFRMNSAYQ